MKPRAPILPVSGIVLFVLALLSCGSTVSGISGLYSGIIQDTDNHRLEGLLQLDTDMHYRYRTIDLSVSPPAWSFEEGTWYLEKGVVGLIRGGKKDLRFEIRNQLLVSETAHAAFPELQEETLALFRISTP